MSTKLTPLPDYIRFRLENWPDKQTAASLHCEVINVQTIRERYGVKRNPDTCTSYDLSPVIDRLGVVTDSELAKEIGCSRWTIAGERNRRGIKPLPAARPAKKTPVYVTVAARVEPDTAMKLKKLAKRSGKSHSVYLREELDQLVAERWYQPGNQRGLGDSGYNARDKAHGHTRRKDSDSIDIIS